MSGPTEDAQRLFEVCVDLLAVSSFDGYLLEVNNAWTRVLGWEREELLARPYVEFLHPDDVERTLGAASVLAAGEEMHGFENRYRCRDGSYRWLSWDAVSDTVARRMYAAVRDVTEQRRGEAMRAQLESITGIGTWEYDIDTDRVFWSPATFAVHGRSPEAASPSLDDALNYYPGAARGRVEAALEEVLSTGQAAELEVPFRTAAGVHRWVRLTASVLARDGRILRVVGTVQDITSQVAERTRLRRFKQLVELSEEGIAEFTADGRVEFANSRLATLLGEDDPTALLGRPAADLLHPEGREEALARARAALERGDRVLRGEIRLANPHRERWVQYALRAEPGAQGGVGHLMAVFTDVTARVQRERELQEARRLLEEAQALGRIGHWHVDVATAAVTASPVVAGLILDDPESELTVEQYLAAVHPDDRALLPLTVDGLPVDEPLDLVHRLVTPTGVERTVQLRATTTTDRQGAPVSVQGTLQDVTALHGTERALQRVLRATNDGWWDEDVVAGVGLYSDRWWEIHGLPPSPGPVPAGVWRRYVPEEELERIDRVFREVTDERRPTFELRGQIRHAAGHLVPIVVRGSIEYDPSGRPTRISGATSDVSEEERVARAKEVFVSTVSHELRTPLTSIGGALELLGQGRGGALTPEAQELVAIGYRNTRRLQALISDLLDVEQLRGGLVPLEREEIDLRAVIRASLADLEPAARAGDVRFAAELPSTPVPAPHDPARIGQVVTNLLANAVKYAPAASTVTTRLTCEDDEVVVEVHDQGPGVPDSFRARAFERFAQADPSDPRSRGGTGLGLAICREIVQQHGGEIDYESRPGSTRFYFSLPLDGQAPDNPG